MFRFLILIIILFFLYNSWQTFEKHLGNNELSKGLDYIDSLKNNPEVKSTINSLYLEIQDSLKQVEKQFIQSQQSPQQKELRKEEEIKLGKPSKQVFSVFNVELGNQKKDIVKSLGPAERSSLNEYGTKWYAYHDHYHNFFMVMYDETNKAAGLYTNEDIISSSNGIKLGSSKKEVRAQLGEPLSRIQKGLVYYQVQGNEDYDVFLVDNTYTTIFYDKHEGNTVTALLLISKDLESKKMGIYTEANQALKEGFEYQLFDLTNASRVNYGLPVLTWDQHVRDTARKHSKDMAVNEYFDHTNLQGKSPFDRMKEDHILFHLAGENLAYGQFSSIFAHEGLMNSLGHRENILRKDYEFLGVGVAFNQESQPYYTENFYAK